MTGLKVFITCPKLIDNIDKYRNLFEKENIQICCPRVLQQLEKEHLLNLVKNYDGWIVGDDIADYDVLYEGAKKGRLKAVVKWGVGVDNIDFKACSELNIKIDNTPDMFGNEVADIAIGYLIMLSRNLHITNQHGKKGEWVNIPGISLKNKNAFVIGFGDIGHNVVERLLASKMKVSIYDPHYEQKENIFFNKSKNIIRKYDSNKVHLCGTVNEIKDKDVIIICCELNKKTKHLINQETFKIMKKGVYLINVARGSIIDTISLVQNLENNKIAGFASDVFEMEPYNKDFILCNNKYKNVILGAHNASNTIEAVDRTSKKAIEKLINFLKFKSKKELSD